MKKLTRSDIIFNNEMVKQFGQQKACEQGKSFSRYVSDLVEKDLDINYNAVKRDFEKEKQKTFLLINQKDYLSLLKEPLNRMFWFT